MIKNENLPTTELPKHIIMVYQYLTAEKNEKLKVKYEMKHKCFDEDLEIRP